MSAAQPARGVAADLAAWVHDAGRAVGESTRGGRVLHGPDGEVETVGDDQAVRLSRRREGRKHLGRRVEAGELGTCELALAAGTRSQHGFHMSRASFGCGPSNIAWSNLGSNFSPSSGANSLIS